MGYSRSEKAIKRVKLVLDEMVASEKNIEWVFDNPADAAYRIYDGIKVSIRSGKEEYKQYTNLLQKFKLKVDEANKTVHAILKPPPDLTPSAVIIRDTSDVFEMISAAIEYKKNRMLFPDFILDEDNMLPLDTWCKNNNYHYVKTTPFELVKNV